METVSSSAFPHKSPEWPGRLSLRPSAWTHRRCAEGRKISRGSSSDRRLVCVWGGVGGERRWTEERRSWWIPAESAHSGWELLQEGRASDWTSASVPLWEADPFGPRQEDGWTEVMWVGCLLMWTVGLLP